MNIADALDVAREIQEGNPPADDSAAVNALRRLESSANGLQRFPYEIMTLHDYLGAW